MLCWLCLMPRSWFTTLLNLAKSKATNEIYNAKRRKLSQVMSAMLFILLSEKATLFLVTCVVFVGIVLSAGVSLYKLFTVLLQHRGKKWQILTRMYWYVFASHSNVAVWTRMYPYVTGLSPVNPGNPCAYGWNSTHHFRWPLQILR